jgi:two-component system, chemotaxis family, chemotaxis protein CheY
MAKILLVDDARTVRLICRRVVSAMGFESLEAENGEVALQIVRDNADLDLILLDWHMPVMDGITFLRTLRSDRTLAQPRVVMCTTQNDIQDISDALTAGADEYIMKPFTEEIIREKLLEAGVN